MRDSPYRLTFSCRPLLGGLLLFAGILTSKDVAAQSDDAFERAPIHYSETDSKDPVAELAKKQLSGTFQLQGEGLAMVRQLLRYLQIPEDSQLLVYSKTSVQRDRISPQHPRAIYFNDETYIGWVPGGLIEAVSVDPILGPVFYQFDPKLTTLTSTPTNTHPHFVRDTDCLRCHGGHFVRDIPSIFVRSIATDFAGEPLFSLGSILVDHSTRISERWAGWYVTGEHRGDRHRGNLFVREDEGRSVIYRDLGTNLVTLESVVDTSQYLRPTSDIVALMLLEHQCGVQNALTRAGQHCRQMLMYQEGLQRDLKEPISKSPVYESVKRSFDASAQDVLDQLLLKDEAKMPEGGIRGSRQYQEQFARMARRTHDGRSLRDLDLVTRLFRHPCSYMIYSSSFQNLPSPLKSRIYSRLEDILTSTAPNPRYPHLNSEDCRNLREILKATLPDLPRKWG